MPTAQPSVRDAWVHLVYERLGANKLDRVACWHRAANWWSLELDRKAPYVLYICDDGRLHVNWAGSADDLVAAYPDLVSSARHVAEPVEHRVPRCVLVLQPDAAAHAKAPAFVDNILARADLFA
jgi:hypothetical protein